MDDVRPGRYRHYKGNDYEVVGVARHSETEEALVVYRPLYRERGLWVRPLSMFVGRIVADGRSVPRFHAVGPSQLPDSRSQPGGARRAHMIFGDPKANIYRNLQKIAAADPAKRLPAGLSNDILYLSQEDPDALALVLEESLVKPRQVVRASWKLPDRKARQAACRDHLRKLEGMFRALVRAAGRNRGLEAEVLRYRFALNMLTLQMNAGDPKKYRI